MAIENGSDFLLKIGDGEAPPTYRTVAGLRTTQMSVNGEAVNVTTKDSGGWRELLSGAGGRSVSVSAAGIFTGSDAEVRLRGHALSGVPVSAPDWPDAIGSVRLFDLPNIGSPAASAPRLSIAGAGSNDGWRGADCWFVASAGAEPIPVGTVRPAAALGQLVEPFGRGKRLPVRPFEPCRDPAGQSGHDAGIGWRRRVAGRGEPGNGGWRNVAIRRCRCRRTRALAPVAIAARAGRDRA